MLLGIFISQSGVRDKAWFVRMVNPSGEQPRFSGSIRDNILYKKKILPRSANTKTLLNLFLPYWKSWCQTIFQKEVTFHSHHYSILVPGISIYNTYSQKIYLWNKPVIHRKSTFAITKMANVPEHTTANCPRRFNHQVGKAAVVCAHPKPCLWWELQRSTEEVTNDISMAYDDFNFMLFILINMSAPWSIIRTSMDIMFKSLFNTRSIFRQIFFNI